MKILKPFNDRELLARIRAIIRRTGDKAATDEPASLSKKSVIPIGDISIDVQKMVVTCQSQVLDLTGSEYALLKHLCLQPGELITKEELSEACLGWRLQAFDRSIDTHISNLRKKLTAANSLVDIKSQRGRGYGIFA